MKKTYLVTIDGNDQFHSRIDVTASNIELALSVGLQWLDGYQKRSIERLQITSIVLVP